MKYSINTNYLEMIAGTSNKYNPLYEAAATNVGKNTNKGIKYLANLLHSIETISEKSAVKDERISKSKGNLRNFEGYDNIKHALDFLTKNLKDVKGVKDSLDLYDLVLKFQPQYTEAYDLKNKLVVYEYESAVYMLATNLSMILANNMDIVSNGNEIRIQKKSAETFGVIPYTMQELLKQMKLSEHAVYLDELNKSFANEELGHVTTEGVYSEALNPFAIVATVSSFGTLAIDIIKNVFLSFKGGLNVLKKVRKSIVGIVPIIRSIAYIRYKKKADTIASLEQQIDFISNNIEQLEKRTNMDPKQKSVIIKKQKAVIEAYKKKSEKLRAQLMEGEKEAATAIDKDSEEIGNTDDDFVLESGNTISSIFTEKKKIIKSHKTPDQIKKFREDMVEQKFILPIVKNEKKDDTELKEFESSVEGIVKEFRLDHKRPCINLNIKESDDKDEKDRTASKIGGNPYWPNDTEWPTYVDAKTNKKYDMICYAQLNFDELPHLDGYPTTGIIQCFIKDEMVYDNDCKLIYHKNYDMSNCIPVNELPVTTFTQDDNEASIDRCWKVVSAKNVDDYISADIILNNPDIEKELIEKIAEKFDESWKARKDIEDKSKRGIINDTIWDICRQSYGTSIGGYPSYTQTPTYENMNLLLQIDSEEGIMWGDSGVAHFFCDEKALKELNFSHKDDVKFQWDCC